MPIWMIGERIVAKHIKHLYVLQFINLTTNKKIISEATYRDDFFKIILILRITDSIFNYELSRMYYFIVFTVS
jgi:hypothetical protein